VIHDKVAAIASYLPTWLQKKLGIADFAAGAPAAGAAPLGAQQVGVGAVVPRRDGRVRVAVDFNNLPKGTTVNTDRTGDTDFELNQGYAMTGAW
jgi:hypothetical protein